LHRPRRRNQRSIGDRRGLDALADFWTWPVCPVVAVDEQVVAKFAHRFRQRRFGFGAGYDHVSRLAVVRGERIGGSAMVSIENGYGLT
jgi:hypothetical protein